MTVRSAPTVPGERLDDLLISFRRDLRAAGRVERTGELYSQSVTFYARWLAEQKREPVLSSLTRGSISAWLAHLSEINAAGTVATRYRGMRRFCRWLVAEEYLERSPMEGMEKPLQREKPVPVLTEDELERLLKTCTGGSFEDRRDNAVLRVLMDCGLRISELAGLQLEDVDLKDADVLRVIGKGRKVRAVPFGAKTGKALDRYIRERRKHPLAATTDALWLSQRGAFSAYGLADRVKIRGAQAGVEGVHPHRFRHTFAADWLASGGQERDLMRLAGWSSDAMLQVYGRATADQRALDAHRRLRRGDRL